MNLKERISAFNALTADEKKSFDHYQKMSDWLEAYVEDNPELAEGYQILFLFSYYYGHDTEWALEIAMRYYDRTQDDLAAVLIVIVEEGFRGGIDKDLFDLLTEIGRASGQLVDICWFYEALYLKKINQPYKELLLQATALNPIFPKAWLELAKVYDDDREQHNFYVHQAIANAHILPYDHELAFSLDYYFESVVYLSNVSPPQLEYIKSQLLESAPP